jgi:hypothetical protein
MAEMPFRCKWVFPREKKCLLDLPRSILRVMLYFMVSFFSMLTRIYYTQIGSFVDLETRNSRLGNLSGFPLFA